MRTIFRFVFVCIVPCILCAQQQKSVRPIQKINKWFQEEKSPTEKHVHKFATLASVSAEGKPYTRMVELVKLRPKHGIVFFTHKNSVKVGHFASNPYAALNIYFSKTGRQVSLTGIVTTVPANQTEAAWNRMPRSMKIDFMVSDHKREPTTLEALENKKQSLKKKYQKAAIPVPDTFIGYQFHPEEIIFYELRKKKIPVKEIAQLKSQNEWICSIVEP